MISCARTCLVAPLGTWNIIYFNIEIVQLNAKHPFMNLSNNYFETILT